MRAVRNAAAMLCVVGWSGTVHAAILSGSYTGLGTEMLFVPSSPTMQTLTDVPTTGTFFVDTAGCRPDSDRPLSACQTVAANLEIIVNALGRTDSFSAPTGLISIRNGAGSQILELDGGYTGPYSYAFLVLAGGVDAFADGVDVQSLRSGPLDLADSYLYAHGGRSYATIVKFTSVVFNPVPEPGSVLLLAGMAVAASLARRRR